MMNPPGMPEGTGDFLLGGFPSIDGPTPGLPEIPEIPLAAIPQKAKLNIPLSEEEQRKLVEYCNTFKQSVRDHADEKKRKMHECYEYLQGRFIGGDNLPSPGTTEGGQNDAPTGRPQLFMPVTRQQFKQIYSQLKMIIFPNDEDFFRIIGGNELAAAFEQQLTEAYKWVFNQNQISEKISMALMNVIWSGFTAAYPCVERPMEFEWSIDPTSSEYVARPKEGDPIITLHAFNPLSFYPDPVANDSNRSKWVYVTRKKIQDLKDGYDLYMNTEQLDSIKDNRASKFQQDKSEFDLNGSNGLQSDFHDVEDYVDYDLYYFPFIKINDQEYRNMMVGIAGEQVVVRFHPNLYPRGLNPVVMSTWLPDIDSPYGTGPLEDMKELQRLINLIWNFVIETAARNPNLWGVSDKVDVSSLFGAAGGIAVAEGVDDIRKHIVPLAGDISIGTSLMNMVGVLKAEAQLISGNQSPFQGSSNVDFKKTATELQIIQENSISMIREVVEHLTNTFIQPILERFMYLIADEYQEPIQIRVDDKFQGTRYTEVDFSIIKQMPFRIEVTSVNLSQSKMAMVNNLMQLFEMAMANPLVMQQLKNGGYNLIKMIADLQGIKNIDQVMMTPNESMTEAMRVQSQFNPLQGANITGEPGV